MNTKTRFQILKEYLIISAGLLIFAAGWTVFIEPNHLPGGGCTGIAALIHYATGVDLSYPNLVLNILLTLVGVKFLGGRFGAKTVYAILFSFLAFWSLPRIIPYEFIQQIAINNGKMLSVIIGGVLFGLGISLVIRCDASSAGTEIIAMIINKFYNVSIGTITVALDIIIISCSLLLPSDASWGARFADVVYGFILAGMFSLSVDYFLTGSKQSVQFLIFSDKYEKLADRIIRNEDHGVSVFDAEGWYSHKKRKVLLVVVRKTDMNRMLSVIKEEDPTAFISVGAVNGVYGLGFERIKK